MNSVAIAGLGWLGKPLATHLQMLGYTVKGSVTTLAKAEELEKSGFKVFPVEINEHGITGEVAAFLSDIDTLIVMIPPGLRRNTGSDYVLKMTHFLDAIEKHTVKNCVFVSSTSVYGDAQGTVTEKDVPIPDNEAGRQLLQVEQLFFTSKCATTIVRFGGLLGGSRQPARYVAGRKNLNGGSAPVNLIHRNDCIQILSEIIKQRAFGHILNAVYPSHPSKDTYYSKKAKELGLEPPEYSKDTNEIFKQVDSVHLKKILEYQCETSI